MIYEYYCDTCGDTFEKQLPPEKRHEPLKVPCGICDGVICKAISSSSFILKGDCWERDGYSKGSDYK